MSYRFKPGDVVVFIGVDSDQGSASGYYFVPGQVLRILDQYNHAGNPMYKVEGRECNVYQKEIEYATKLAKALR